MFIGHFAPALVAATLPKAPRLGTLFIAAQLVDIAFFIFVMLGIENMRLTPGITVMTPLDLYDMPYTHSLGGGIIFAAALAWIFYYFTRNAIGAMIAGMVVISHWFVDLIVHAPDLTLMGSPPKLGLGLWDYPLLEMPLELGLTGAAFGYYLSRTQDTGGRGLIPALWLGGVMLALQLLSWFAPHPETLDMSLPISVLFAFGLFAWLAHRVGQARTAPQM